MMRTTLAVVGVLLLSWFSTASATPSTKVWEPHEEFASAEKYYQNNAIIKDGFVEADSFTKDLFMKAYKRGLHPNLDALTIEQKNEYLAAYQRKLLEMNALPNQSLTWEQVGETRERSGYIALPSLTDAEAILAAVSSNPQATTVKEPKALTAKSPAPPKELVAKADYRLGGESYPGTAKSTVTASDAPKVSTGRLPDDEIEALRKKWEATDNVAKQALSTAGSAQTTANEAKNSAGEALQKSRENSADISDHEKRLVTLEHTVYGKPGEDGGLVEKSEAHNLALFGDGSEENPGLKNEYDTLKGKVDEFTNTVGVAVQTALQDSLVFTRLKNLETWKDDALYSIAAMTAGLLVAVWVAFLFIRSFFGWVGNSIGNLFKKKSDPLGYEQNDPYIKTGWANQSKGDVDKAA